MWSCKVHVASRHSPWGQCWISLVYFGLGSVVQAISLVYGPQEISIVDLFFLSFFTHLFYTHFFLWYHILFFHFPFLTFLFHASVFHVWFLLIDSSLDRLVCHHPLSLSPWSLARGSSGAVVWIVGSWISYTFDTVEDAFYRKPEIFYGEEKLLLSNYVSFLGLALHFR